MSKQRQEKLFWGIILLLIGSLFMLDSLGIDIDIWNFFGKYWPTILIGIGLKNIWLHYRSRDNKKNLQ